MIRKLCYQAMLKFFLGVMMVGGLLFFSAGSFYYWQAWLLMTILFIPMLGLEITLLVKNPDLLRKRLNAKEEHIEQKWVIKMSGVIFTAGFVVAGLTFRWQRLVLPNWVSWIGAILFLVAYVMYVEVLRENCYLSRVVEVQENQEIIDDGLYGIVRHPMYSATLVLFLSIPLVLGSISSFIIFLLYPLIIVKRIRNEEQVLAKGLRGYTAYQEKVRYKLIPWIW